MKKKSILCFLLIFIIFCATACEAAVPDISENNTLPPTEELENSSELSEDDLNKEIEKYQEIYAKSPSGFESLVYYKDGNCIQTYYTPIDITNLNEDFLGVLPDLPEWEKIGIKQLSGRDLAQVELMCNQLSYAMYDGVHLDDYDSLYSLFTEETAEKFSDMQLFETRRQERKDYSIIQYLCGFDLILNNDSVYEYTDETGNPVYCAYLIPSINFGGGSYNSQYADTNHYVDYMCHHPNYFDYYSMGLAIYFQKDDAGNFKIRQFIENTYRNSTEPKEAELYAAADYPVERFGDPFYFIEMNAVKYSMDGIETLKESNYGSAIYEEYGIIQGSWPIVLWGDGKYRYKGTTNLIDNKSFHQALLDVAENFAEIMSNYTAENCGEIPEKIKPYFQEDAYEQLCAGNYYVWKKIYPEAVFREMSGKNYFEEYVRQIQEIGAESCIAGELEVNIYSEGSNDIFVDTYADQDGNEYYAIPLIYDATIEMKNGIFTEQYPYRYGTKHQDPTLLVDENAKIVSFYS